MNENPGGKFWFPSGHFYSPIPELEEIKKREQEIFFTISKEVPVQLNYVGASTWLRKERSRINTGFQTSGNGYGALESIGSRTRKNYQHKIRGNEAPMTVDQM